MTWTGRSGSHGPEGLLGLGRKSPETHGPEGRVEYGLERRMCVRVFWELTKHLCLQLLSYVFQVLARTVGRRRRDSYTLERGFDFCDLGIRYVLITIVEYFRKCFM